MPPFDAPVLDASSECFGAVNVGNQGSILSTWTARMIT